MHAALVEQLVEAFLCRLVLDGDRRHVGEQQVGARAHDIAGEGDVKPVVAPVEAVLE
ncbi:hypothetical protein [Streptomyces malaysiensis]|uniref:Uncharacterized protein n=1 Tax=Streptomyces malaysiensis TaxID=92644 RepID=A0A7X5XAR3_STRMQ|nr:hypothetical protein [Streptomyces malaysiensis]